MCVHGKCKDMLPSATWLTHHGHMIESYPVNPSCDVAKFRSQTGKADSTFTVENEYTARKHNVNTLNVYC